MLGYVYFILGNKHAFPYTGSIVWGFVFIYSGMGLDLQFVVAVVTISAPLQIQIPLRLPYVCLPAQLRPFLYTSPQIDRSIPHHCTSQCCNKENVFRVLLLDTIKG